MKYRALAENLIPTAEAVRRYFSDQEGAKRFRAESPAVPDASYSPTLLADSQDKGLLAIEVNEGGYTDALDKFVLDSIAMGLPIRLFVAYQVGGPSAQTLELHRRAKSRGIGIVEVIGRRAHRLLPALPLSLLGVRSIDTKAFAKRYRPLLSQAEETFRNGDPAKGCGRVYDLIERHTRELVVEIERLNLWKPTVPAAQRAPRFIQTGAWAKVLGLLNEHADLKGMSKAHLRLTNPLLGRVIGLTPHRNDTGHEPSSLQVRMARDAQLRTRFEHAVDTFAEFVVACPLKVPK